jgi:cell wall-associated NlpC family hydrolase
MALVTASASPAQAPARHVSAKQDTEALPVIKADAKHVAFDRVEVHTEAAPAPQIVQAPREVEQNIVRQNPAPAKLPAVSPPKAAPAAPPAPPKPAPVVQPPLMAGTLGAAIAAAALAQLGRRQDCTMLVTNSLAAVGITHHGWPISYTALGTRVPAGQEQPGDLIYYVNGGMGVAHVAVYVGNGLAVHGGWEGFKTVTFKANVGSGPVFIRVG